MRGSGGEGGVRGSEGGMFVTQTAAILYIPHTPNIESKPQVISSAPKITQKHYII